MWKVLSAVLLAFFAVSIVLSFVPQSVDPEVTFVFPDYAVSLIGGAWLLASAAVKIGIFFNRKWGKLAVISLAFYIVILALIATAHVSGNSPVHWYESAVALAVFIGWPIFDAMVVLASMPVRSDEEYWTK